MNKDIIEKIQKLLALANSSNENEAKLAAAKAQELLIKYNLSMSQIETDENRYEMELIATGKGRISSEYLYIQSLLCEFYFVRIVKSKRVIYDGFWPKNEAVYLIFGAEHNIKIAKYVDEFLVQAFQRLFKQYRIKTNAPATSKHSFYLGLYHGLREQLLSTIKKVEQETGLVVVNDANLDEWIQEQMKIKQTKDHKVDNVDNAAINSGYQEGKKLTISKGLDSGESKQNIGQTLRLAGK